MLTDERLDGRDQFLNPACLPTQVAKNFRNGTLAGHSRRGRLPSGMERRRARQFWEEVPESYASTGDELQLFVLFELLQPLKRLQRPLIRL